MTNRREGSRGEMTIFGQMEKFFGWGFFVVVVGFRVLERRMGMVKKMLFTMSV